MTLTVSTNGVHTNGQAKGSADETLRAIRNVQVEESLLGALLVDNARMHEVALILETTDFFVETHKTIFERMLDRYEAGQPFDARLISDDLERNGDLQAIGGDETLFGLLNNAGLPVNADYYARIIREKSIARQLHESATEISTDVLSLSHTADELLERAERRIFALAERQVAGGSKDSRTLISESLARIERRRRGELVGIETGYPELDSYVEGLRPGNLVVVAARPSIGKTALGLNICEHASLKLGIPVLFISLEMDAAEVGDRLLSGQARVDSRRIRHPRYLSAQDEEAIAAAAARLAEGCLYIDDTPGRTIVQIGAMSRYSQARYGIGLVVIDYLTLIDGLPKRGDSRQEEVAKISRRLKTLARELKIPVVVLHQLNRESEKRKDRRPMLADLRESGAIEQDADIVLLLHRPEFYDPNDKPGIAEVYVAKNRNGQTGTATLTFLKSLTRFENYAPAVAF